MNGTLQIGPGHQAGQPAALRAFTGAALRRPGVVGAVAPSSSALARALSAIVPTTGPAVVVELGPGTGPVSDAIRGRLAPGSRQLAVEIDPAMVTYLRRAKPWLEVVHGDAAELGALLAPLGVERADAVVSTLPWSLFPADPQRRILREVGRVLAPAGAFTTVAYLSAVAMPSSWAFRRRLRAAFDEVLTTGPVWRNMPPGLVHVCRRPVARERSDGE
ncbi:methyltransferase domain-containing protein [Microbispora sp. RL4-1S]|uniref:Methyltransferase domain-containing protein n=1 Tax=Microbispora oryzae TaxID=2806554 RepID=A0A941AJ84_9ACTN|nr:methyltransferase domain-containing protein [Microbispora oryzae]MBP2706045.1 methyltransferase domain-containing protein [Microbispora oryzae]